MYRDPIKGRQRKTEAMRRLRAERREQGFRYYKPTPAPIRALSKAISQWSQPCK